MDDATQKFPVSLQPVLFRLRTSQQTTPKRDTFDGTPRLRQKTVMKSKLSRRHSSSIRRDLALTKQGFSAQPDAAQVTQRANWCSMCATTRAGAAAQPASVCRTDALVTRRIARRINPFRHVPKRSSNCGGTSLIDWSRSASVSPSTQMRNSSCMDCSFWNRYSYFG